MFDSFNTSIVVGPKAIKPTLPILCCDIFKLRGCLVGRVYLLRFPESKRHVFPVPAKLPYVPQVSMCIGGTDATLCQYTILPFLDNPTQLPSACPEDLGY